MLKSILIKNYKNLNSVIFNLDFNDAIIYGENGVGKTNLCHILKLLRQWTLLAISSKEVRWPELANSSFAFNFRSETDAEYLLSYDSVGRMDIEELRLNSEVLYKYSHVRQKYLAEHFEAYNLSIPDVASYASFNIAMPVLRLMFNSGNCDDNIRALFLYIVNMQIIDGVQLCVDKVQATASHEATLIEGFMNSVGLNMHLEMRESPVPTLMAKTSKGLMPFDSVASTGERAIANLVMNLNQSETCSLLCIDEFDAFYHYQLGKHMLLDVIPTIGKQYVLTTHNTSFLNLVDHNKVYILNKEGCHHLADLTSRKLGKGLDFEHLFRAGEFDV